MRPHAFDANAIHAFQQERKSEANGPARAALERIFNGDCIALDEDGLCLQEWLDCAESAVPFALGDWVADQMIHGRIRSFPLCTENLRKMLLNLGLPKKDHKWVRLAIGCGGNLIITNDIDFFDPKKKNASAQQKKKIKENGGSCSKFLQKKLGVEVTCMVRFSEGC